MPSEFCPCAVHASDSEPAARGRAHPKKSLGQPFLAPGSPRRTHNPDLLLRAPTFRQRLRTYLSNPEEMKRAYGRMRRFDGRNKE